MKKSTGWRKKKGSEEKLMIIHQCYQRLRIKSKKVLFLLKERRCSKIKIRTFRNL